MQISNNQGSSNLPINCGEFLKFFSGKHNIIRGGTGGDVVGDRGDDSIARITRKRRIPLGTTTQPRLKNWRAHLSNQFVVDHR